MLSAISSANQHPAGTITGTPEQSISTRTPLHARIVALAVVQRTNRCPRSGRGRRSRRPAAGGGRTRWAGRRGTRPSAGLRRMLAGMLVQASDCLRGACTKKLQSPRRQVVRPQLLHDLSEVLHPFLFTDQAGTDQA